MQGLRLKFGGDRRNDWQCCFCCHVRTGTIFLGLWHLILHVVMLYVMALILQHPELFDPDMDPVPVLPTPLSVDTLNDHHALGTLEISQEDSTKPMPLLRRSCKEILGSRSFSHHDINFFIIVTFCTFAMTLLLLFGAIKGKPSYLMPFFCLQVFEFCINSLTAIGYTCNPPDLKEMIAQSKNVPYKEELLNMNPQTLSLATTFSFLMAMAIKGYFICVIWSCYKYLTLRQVAAQRTVQFIDPDFQNLLPDLPDYETAVKKHPTPPPSYDHAMRAHLPVVVDVNRYGPGFASTIPVAATSQPSCSVPPVPQHV